MKTLIIYYSQTGNTQKIARAIRDGMRSAGSEVALKYLPHVTPEELQEYDCIGIGSPVWYEMPPNLRRFVEDLPAMDGKPCFNFCTHGTMPDLYFPLVIPRLQRKGFKVVDWKNWYGNAVTQIFPDPYYTAGHPDAIDLADAFAFGEAVTAKFQLVLDGDDSQVPDAPMPNMMPLHANAAIDHLGGFHNVHGAMVRDPEKCLYPKCHICMDNCTMGYIDLEASPQRYGSLGNQCDDCHGCTYCELLCPVGAIHPVVPYEIAAPVGQSHGSALFEMVLSKAREEGKFRPLIPFDQVGDTTPFYSTHAKHPRIKQLSFKED